jgi:ubiquinone/menaquinone biosynthesis C-methylase UbiE
MPASSNEIKAANAFSKQSVLFDLQYAQDTIVQYKRTRVRAHVNSFLQPASHILELNAGTGEDAVYFAGEGHIVHATDISSGMLDKLKEKVNKKALTHKVSSELCSYTLLGNISAKGPYDHIFSNFAGLNCTNELDKVLLSLPPLLKTGGVVTLVMLPKFCLWEFLLIGKGKFQTALRRFTGKKGARSHIEGEYFTCWYYNPSYIITHLAKDFDWLQTEGLCTFVPPSYINGFAEKYPRLYAYLCRLENRYSYAWPWRSIGDYYIISLRKK